MKFTRSLLTTSLVSVLLSGCITVNASSVDYQATETLNLSASGIDQLSVDAGAGFMIIEGDDSLDNIQVIGDISAYANKYKFSLVKKGNKAVLISDPNSKDISNWFGGDSPKIDLTIKVPRGMSLSVDDGSGDIDISNIDGEVYVDDGSGSLSLKSIGNSVEIEDGSGNLALSDIKGAIKIDDGSGNLEVRRAGSSIEIEDGSGQITLVDVAGKVSVDDGSGNLLIKQVKGHVTINDGSGDIDVVDLEDGLTVLNAGSGGLSIQKVQGNIITK